MLSSGATRLEVWGDPISHSRSPQLHAAAYRVLGLEWTYGRRRVPEAAFDHELAGLSERWRGLSLTMPLKTRAYQAARTHDRHAALTGAVNTLLLTDDGPRGFNTDVGGIVRALQAEASPRIERARILGAGATATSALVALAQLGAGHVEILARRAGAAEPLARLGSTMGVEVTCAGFDATRYAEVAATISTLPGDAAVPAGVAGALAARGGLLMDVVYGRWPTPLAQAWQHAERPAISGLGMLLHQALLQVRVFVQGDADTALASEATVLAEMRSALVGD